MEDDHTEELSDGTLARGDDHSNYTHKQEYVEVIDADVTWRMIILRSRQMVLLRGVMTTVIILTSTTNLRRAQLMTLLSTSYQYLIEI